MLNRSHILPLVLLFAMSAGAHAQDIGSLQRVQRPPLANPNDPNIPAKELFGRKPEPAPMGNM